LGKKSGMRSKGGRISKVGEMDRLTSAAKKLLTHTCDKASRKNRQEPAKKKETARR